MRHLAGKMQRAVACAVLGAFWLGFAARCGAAAEATREPADPTFAFWAGADANDGAWSVYAGTEHAIYGRMDAVGWRLRAGGGYGRYGYSRAVYKPADGGGERPGRQHYTGHKYFSDVLIGYQFQWDATTAKLFGGGNSEHHTITPYDPKARVDSAAYGLKIAGEVWHRFSATHWVAGHASYSTAFDTYKIEARSGWRVIADVDLGLEARVEGNDDYDGGRVGAFATVHLGAGALTLAAGAAADRDMTASPYATLGFFMRY